MAFVSDNGNPLARVQYDTRSTHNGSKNIPFKTQGGIKESMNAKLGTTEAVPKPNSNKIENRTTCELE